MEKTKTLNTALSGIEITEGNGSSFFDRRKAEKIFKEDLQENPNNHWALYGLSKSLLKQKKIGDFIIIKKQFIKAFEGADITAGAIIF